MLGLLDSGEIMLEVTKLPFDDFADEASGATAAWTVQPCFLQVVMKFAGVGMERMVNASAAPEAAFWTVGRFMGAQVFVQMATASTP